ncbi:MAG: hypothetical protein U0Z75_04565 [Deinococcaceae bacterium]
MNDKEINEIADILRKYLDTNEEKMPNFLRKFYKSIGLGPDKFYICFKYVERDYERVPYLSYLDLMYNGESILKDLETIIEDINSIRLKVVTKVRSELDKIF